MLKERCSVTSEELKEMVQLLSTGQWKCTTFEHKVGDGTFIRLSDNKGGIREYHCPHSMGFCPDSEREFKAGDRVKIRRPAIATDRGMDTSHGTVTRKIGYDGVGVLFDGVGFSTHVKNEHLEFVPNEVNRLPEIGEYIKIVWACNQTGYKCGDILKVTDFAGDKIVAQTNSGEVHHIEMPDCVVLEGYQPPKTADCEKESRPTKKFIFGDRVRLAKDLGTLLRLGIKNGSHGTYQRKISANMGNVRFDGKNYTVPIDNSYLEPVPDEISRRAEVGEYVKVISTECTRLHIGDILKVINTAADAFVKAQTSSGDIVKLYHYEYVVLNGYSPRYNGRILFTKGDSVFVTGHIYEVVDGKIDDDYGQQVPLFKDDFFTSFADVKNYFAGTRPRVWSKTHPLEIIEVHDN